MLKKAYKNFWVPVMGRLLSNFIPILEGKKPNRNPTYDIDSSKKSNSNDSSRDDK